MNDVNTIIIYKEDHKTQEVFEDAVKRAIMVLLENNYIMTVRWDEPGWGILRIDYGHDDQSLGANYPYWLSPEEIESVISDDE